MRYIAYMKTKAITRIILPAIVIALCGFVLIRRQSKTSLEKEEIRHFLTGINNALVKVDSVRLQTYLADKNNPDEVYRLIAVLKGRYRQTYADITPKLKLYVSADTNHIDINVADSGITATIPVTFKSDYLKPKTSKLDLRVQKLSKNKYKIFEINTKSLTDDYTAYEDKAYVALEISRGKYQPITKKAFANAITLKTRYDSVIWFSHVKGKTYYYAVKGHWNFDSAFDPQNDSLKKYKMALVGPNLKDVIPAGFDMIRSINGTFPGLVEVEKDHKHGFYNLDGKLIVPVQYDQVFPVKDSNNKAALRIGRDFYWLKNDYTISSKTNLKIGEVFSMLAPTPIFTGNADPTGNITEFNSDYEDGTISLPPSHLVDLNLTYNFAVFNNPLRKEMQVSFSSFSSNFVKVIKQTQRTETPKEEKGNWLKGILYSITEHFIRGRFEFYKTNNLVLIDEKHNQAYGQYIRSGYSRGELSMGSPHYCNDYSVRAINDTLIEVKTSAATNISLYNKDLLAEMPIYHYIVLKNNRMDELKLNRLFSFTQYVKMDDQYLDGCYTYYANRGRSTSKVNQTTRLSKSGLLYMRNEIYANYHYKFKDNEWNEIFYSMAAPGTKYLNNVDDSLTVIDRYNIQWIDQKLKKVPVTTSLASR